jgi:RNA polymerase sigma-70 factor (ECF subfamily)
MQHADDALAAHRESVWGFVLRQVGDRALADDLTQETFLRAQRSIHSYRGEASLRSWVFSIALNVVRDQFRALRRSPESTCEAAAADQASPDEGGERALLESEMATCVGEYLLRLPRLQHDVVALHDMAGLTHGEIAAALGVSVSNSRVLLHRGHAALREILEQNCLLSFDGDSIPCERKPAPKAGGSRLLRAVVLAGILVWPGVTLAAEPLFPPSMGSEPPSTGPGAGTSPERESIRSIRRCPDQSVMHAG